MTQTTINAAGAAGEETPLADAPCFIEVQFPVSKVSKESFRERKANHGQTLTGLGKWWGRKPLVLCRAAILGVLLPATDDPKKDRATFLALMTMDATGLMERRESIPEKELFRRLSPAQRQEYFTDDSTEQRPRFRPKTRREVKDMLQEMLFASMSYDEKLKYARRPEEIAGPTAATWEKVNAHLGTAAHSLPELVAELGRRRFGHAPRVGDAFCGGGSVPFEAARIGCDAWGSDLNPVAALLTWASLNIVGGGPEVAKEVRAVQDAVYKAVDKQVIEWGIEDDGSGWRADAFLYCVETNCPECGWRVPLSPSWVIGEGTKTIAVLREDAANERYHIDIRSGVSDAEMAAAEAAATVKDSALHCPRGCHPTPMTTIRRDGMNGQEFGLRMWENDDLIPRPDDTFGERLYCVRWFKEVPCDRANGRKGEETIREYRAVTDADTQRERRALELLQARFADWQRREVIPARKIRRGQETTRLLRERGWTHWHHLFNPRQLLMLGLINDEIEKSTAGVTAKVGCVLGLQRCADHNSRLSAWSPVAGKELVDHVFANQALNTVLNPGTRAFTDMKSAFTLNVKQRGLCRPGTVEPRDARELRHPCDLWMTDPPYADAISYDELTEFFLAWSSGFIAQNLPQWYRDTKRAMAVRGSGEDFRRAMVACYRRMAELMPLDGIQIVMFTHQNSAVWADLALILWAAGLRVSAAWCIATETDSALKEGNYVQGTVLLILRKKSQSAPEVFLGDVYQMVELEVRRQLDSMLALDDREDPNFTDNDYRLAAYAAALRVLTQNPIAEIDVEHELSKERGPGERPRVAELIDNAVAIACDHLIPTGVDRELWRALGRTERMYVAGLEQESHGERRNGVYMESARGFGLKDYRFLLASTKANETRLKTASELGRRDLEGASTAEGLRTGASLDDRKEFARSLLRQALFAVFKTAETDGPAAGMAWLKTEVADYWNQRERLVQLLGYLAALGANAGMPHWHADAEAARVLAGAVENDHV